ncbi:MAG TPA: hemerythrin domain-containing protein [Aeromicrobium sp.]|nr:hemerythrin domain-containing protein [Aeromicrobium sp.]
MSGLAEALTIEHRQIDDGIERFVAAGDVAALRSAFEALRRHIYLEEEFLFPPVRGAGLLMPVMVMIREHGALWQRMDAIESSLDRGDDTAESCRELLARLDDHNSKEEPVVYPHADSDLSAEQTAGLSQFLQSGTLPDDWICEALRA